MLNIQNKMQPPSGGCVLKPSMQLNEKRLDLQPPSGGCVLKPVKKVLSFADEYSSRLRAAVC